MEHTWARTGQFSTTLNGANIADGRRDAVNGVLLWIDFLAPADELDARRIEPDDVQAVVMHALLPWLLDGRKQKARQNWLDGDHDKKVIEGESE